MVNNWKNLWLHYHEVLSGNIDQVIHFMRVHLKLIFLSKSPPPVDQNTFFMKQIIKIDKSFSITVIMVTKRHWQRSCED